MLYALIKDGQLAKYPYTFNDLRAAYPDMIWPDPIGPELCAQLGVHMVTPMPTPPFNNTTEMAVEEDPILLPDGTWQQQWKVVARYDTQAERDAALAAELALLQAGWSDRIDSAVAAACARPQRFTTEYLRREQQARSYVAQHDTMPKGEPAVPPLIASFAASAGLPPYTAACVTISQADALYAVLDQLANLRMRKYEVKRATSIATARAAFDAVMADIGAVVVP